MVAAYPRSSRSKASHVQAACLVTAIGVISGTSMDGIDVVGRRDGRGRRCRDRARGRPIPIRPHLRQRLLELHRRAEREPRPTRSTTSSRGHGRAYRRHPALHGGSRIDALRRSISSGFTARPSITGRRCVSPASSASASRSAEQLGIDTVDRFRHADVASGGEGAPFAPLYHRALAATLDQPVMVLNLGGVGNVTYIDGDTVIAFDTGPGERHPRRLRAAPPRACLRRGRRACRLRHARREARRRLHGQPLFRPRPRRNPSTGKTFMRGRRASRRCRTPTARRPLPSSPSSRSPHRCAMCRGTPPRWLVTGGGRSNAHFMRRLRERLGVPRRSRRGGRLGRRFPRGSGFGYLAVRSQRAACP